MTTDTDALLATVREALTTSWPQKFEQLRPGALAALDALSEHIRHLEQQLREADLDATDSDGMFPRNPLL